MSDEDFMLEDEEDYGFEYEDDDDEDMDGSADIENKYYTAKSHKADSPDQAFSDFESIVEQETEMGEWGFKALKQATKLAFKLQRFDESLSYYKRLLPYTKRAVTRNASEKAINGVLDYVSASPNLDVERMQQFYEETLKSLNEYKNERLSTKTNLKLAKLWLDRRNYAQLQKLLRELHESVAPSDDEMDDGLDNTKGTLLLEIYAIEIQMHGEMKNNKKLKEIYDQTLSVRSAVPHPQIMGVIRECGGKMRMSEREWAEAQVDFFEAFRNYDEAGSPQRIQVLKYLVLAHMLMGSKINPFDSQETKPYKNNPEITAMTKLVAAYQESNVHEAESVIGENRRTIMDDPFIAEYISDVLRSLRTQWIVDIISPYTRIQTSYLAKQLNVSVEEVEQILISLILDDKVKGRIDQIRGELLLDRHKKVDNQRYSSMSDWSDQLIRLQTTLTNKATNLGPGTSQMPFEMASTLTRGKELQETDL